MKGTNDLDLICPPVVDVYHCWCEVHIFIHVHFIAFKSSAIYYCDACLWGVVGSCCGVPWMVFMASVVGRHRRLSAERRFRIRDLHTCCYIAAVVTNNLLHLFEILCLELLCIVLYTWLTHGLQIPIYVLIFRDLKKFPLNRYTKCRWESYHL